VREVDAGIPKPMPAYVAASIIPSRASRSSGWSTARRNQRPSRPSAVAQMSLIGFEPL
jgi:hypothetical protein